MLAGVVSALTAKGVRIALAGGLAVAAHGVPHATKDLDLLIAAEDKERAGSALRDIGFAVEIERPGFTRYVRHPLAEPPEISEWTDLLLARHSIGLQMLDEAQAAPVAFSETLALPVVSLQSLILMKLLALIQDPQRPHDRADVIALLRRHGERIDRAAVAAGAANIGEDVAQAWASLLSAFDHASDDSLPIDRL